MGLWGASRAGKTTFLAALAIAAMRSQSAEAWVVGGMTNDATDFLVQHGGALLSQKFPDSTTGDVENLRWSFHGTASRQARLTRRRVTDTVEFILELQEYSGEDIADTRVDPAIVEHVAPGRAAEVRPPTPLELKGTSVLRMSLAECSAKVRTGGPVDDEEDYALPCWAGVVPLRLVPGEPVPDTRLRPGTQVSESIAALASDFRRRGGQSAP